MIHSDNNYLPAQRPEAVPAVYSPEVASLAVEADIDVRAHINMLYRRRRLILIVLGMVFVLGMLYTLTRRPIYESTSKILVFTKEPQTASSYADLPAMRNIEMSTASRSIDTQIEIISSPDLLDAAFSRLDENIRRVGFRSNTIPGWAVRMGQAKDADIITVTTRAYSPEAAANLAEAIATQYFQQDVQQNNQAIRKARIYVEEKMAVAERELGEAQDQLSRFKRASGLFAPDTQFTKQAEQMAELSANIDAAKAEIAARRQENAALQRRISSEQKAVAMNTTIVMNPQFTTALDRIDKLQTERAGLLQEYTPESREIREIEDRIANEEGRLKQIATTIVGSKLNARNPIRDTLLTQYSTGVAAQAAATARLNALQLEARSYEQAAGAMPGRERQLADRMRRVAILERTYEMLSSRYQTLLLGEQAILPSGMLAVKPRVAASPAYPKTASNAVLFLLLGGLTALIAAIVAERLDVRVHDPQLAEHLSGTTALSIIPTMPNDCPRLNNGGAEKPILLESFRILRNNIATSGLAQGMKVIAIISPGRGEGKSITAANLALTMAMDGTRVLLVDGDTRHPSVHQFMGVPGETGLSDVLAGSLSVGEAIRTTSVENVDCLPSGSALPNAAELLRSEASRALFTELRERYDAVLIDCPPAVGLSDTQAISVLADGVLLVVSMNLTLRPHLDSTMRMLSNAGVPVVGMVVNRMDMNLGAYGYYCEDYSGRRAV